jgi:hypothetical protein
MKTIIILIIALLQPVLAQDTNTTPIVFVDDPILPMSDQTNTDIYPVIPDVRVMATVSYDMGNTYDGWLNGALAFLGMNVSLPANVSRNDSLQVA